MDFEEDANKELEELNQKEQQLNKRETLLKALIDVSRNVWQAYSGSYNEAIAQEESEEIAVAYAKIAAYKVITKVLVNKGFTEHRQEILSTLGEESKLDKKGREERIKQKEEELKDIALQREQLKQEREGILQLQFEATVEYKELEESLDKLFKEMQEQGIIAEEDFKEPQDKEQSVSVDEELEDIGWEGSTPESRRGVKLDKETWKKGDPTEFDTKETKPAEPDVGEPPQQSVAVTTDEAKLSQQPATEKISEPQAPSPEDTAAEQAPPSGFGARIRGFFNTAKNRASSLIETVLPAKPQEPIELSTITEYEDVIISATLFKEEMQQLATAYQQGYSEAIKQNPDAVTAAHLAGKKAKNKAKNQIMENMDKQEQQGILSTESELEKINRRWGGDFEKTWELYELNQQIDKYGEQALFESETEILQRRKKEESTATPVATKEDKDSSYQKAKKEALDFINYYEKPNLVTRILLRLTPKVERDKITNNLKRLKELVNFYDNTKDPEVLQHRATTLENLTGWLLPNIVRSKLRLQSEDIPPNTEEYITEELSNLKTASVNEQQTKEELQKSENFDIPRYEQKKQEFLNEFLQPTQSEDFKEAFGDYFAGSLELQFDRMNTNKLEESLISSNKYATKSKKIQEEESLGFDLKPIKEVIASTNKNLKVVYNEEYEKAASEGNRHEVAVLMARNAVKKHFNGLDLSTRESFMKGWDLRQQLNKDLLEGAKEAFNYKPRKPRQLEPQQQKLQKSVKINVKEYNKFDEGWDLYERSPSGEKPDKQTKNDVTQNYYWGEQQQLKTDSEREQEDNLGKQVTAAARNTGENQPKKSVLKKDKAETKERKKVTFAQPEEKPETRKKQPVTFHFEAKKETGGASASETASGNSAKIENKAEKSTNPEQPPPSNNPTLKK